ncbi:MAG: hypothetical protein ACFFCW_35255, partial [Candidatus Hodarchaeota archaeon]
WNSLMGSGSYNEVMNIATTNGFSSSTWTTFSWDSTWTVAAYAAIWAYGSPATPPTSVAGEVSVPSKTHILGTTLGTVLIASYYVSVSAAMYRACDPFIRAYSYNQVHGYWDQYTITPKITPSLPFFAGVLSGNLGLSAFFAASAAIWLWNDIPPFFLYLTRFIFAWSFDRTFPTYFAEVHPTLQSPLRANILVLILSILACILCWNWWVYGYFTLLDNVACLAWIFPDMFVALAATVAPLVRPNVYKESPIAAWKIGSIPIISIIGPLAFGGITTFVFLVAATLVVTPTGLVAFTPDILLVVGWLVLGLIITAAFWGYNQRKGIPVSEIYRVLPPA